MTDFIGKHLQYHKDGPGSKLLDGGAEIFCEHLITPYELVSDKHYHVYVKFGYARAYLSVSPYLKKWQMLYETMQRDKGRIPDVTGFNKLIESIKQKGFRPEYAIPVDENYDILDGSHRLATALALDIPIYVQMFSKVSKNYGKERLTSFNSADFALVEQERKYLFDIKNAATHGSLMTIWGASLNIWNEVLPQIGYNHIKRSFLRNFTKEEYLAYIATVYAGDGISNSSLTRKSWALEKYKHQAGVLLLDYTPEELQQLKIKIRENFINKVQQYHFDSIVHTIDNTAITPQILSLIEPYKPNANMVLHRDILPPLKNFLAANAHTTPEYQKAISEGKPNAFTDIVDSRIKLVIFDLDGVITDSEMISARAYQMVLQDRGINISIDEACKTFCGVSKKDAATILAKKYSVVLSPKEEQKKKIWIRKEKLRMQKVPDILEFIKKIKCKKCIASGSSVEGIKRSLQIVGLDDMFSDDEIFSSQNVKTGKPSPELFIKIADKYATAPDQTMVMEDSLPGIVAANRAKMHYIWCGRASHIPHTYTKDLLIPLTKSEYFRSVETSAVISSQMSYLLHSGNGLAK